MHLWRLLQYCFMESRSMKSELTLAIATVRIHSRLEYYALVNMNIRISFERLILVVAIYCIFVLANFKHTTAPIDVREIKRITEHSNQKKNVLFIIVDDLRPQFGFYMAKEIRGYFGNTTMYTPNLDELASRSLVFTRAYVQFSLCGPSRASMLTSRRPDTTRVFGNHNYWRTSGGNFSTLPQYFKQHGYVSMGLGKVYHKRSSSGKDDPLSWSVKYFKPPFTDAHYIAKRSGKDNWKPALRDERDKVPLADDHTVTTAMEWLEEWKKESYGETPFFMAVGFRKPHLPLVCPQECYNRYTLETNRQFLVDVEWQHPQEHTMTFLNKSRNYTRGSDKKLRERRRAYRACISYIDSLIGQLIDKLKLLQLDDSTIVSFVADHGYHLGENGHLGKHVNLELATRIPFMIRVPGLTDSGKVTDAIVEAVDMFPTLVAAAGLPHIQTCSKISTEEPVCTEGQSLLSLFANPKSVVKQGAFSQVSCGTNLMHYSIRTPEYRYSEVARITLNTTLSHRRRLQYDVSWDIPNTRAELYYHKADHIERYNVIDENQHISSMKEIRELLRDYVHRMYLTTKLS